MQWLFPETAISRAVGVVTCSTAHWYENAYPRWPTDWTHGATDVSRGPRDSSVHGRALPHVRGSKI